MLYDAHCHPTDSPETLEQLKQLEVSCCIMATRFDDLDLVAATQGPNIWPAFGLHPWYSHLVSFAPTRQEHYSEIFGEGTYDQFPEPVPFEQHLARIEALLLKYPKSLIGEIGLDKAAKVKLDGEITPYRTSMQHQQRVFEAQLALAAKHGRAASVHGVQCHMPLLESCTRVVKEYGKNLRICLHSFSGTPEFASQRWLKFPAPVYFSVATLINGKNRDKALALVRALPADRVLSESDYHTAGDYLYTLLEESVALCDEGGVDPEQLAANFMHFVGEA